MTNRASFRDQKYMMKQHRYRWMIDMLMHPKYMKEQKQISSYEVKHPDHLSQENKASEQANKMNTEVVASKHE